MYEQPFFLALHARRSERAIQVFEGEGRNDEGSTRTMALLRALSQVIFCI